MRGEIVPSCWTWARPSTRLCDAACTFDIVEGGDAEQLDLRRWRRIFKSINWGAVELLSQLQR